MPVAVTSKAKAMSAIESQNRYEIQSMPFAEQFLLWGVREWVYAFVGGYDRHELLREGFQRLDLEEGYLALDNVLTIISTAATHKIEVRCPKCSTASIDEQMIIGMLAAHQRDTRDSCVATFDGWLPPTAARIIREPATQLALAMKQRGLILRRRQICPECTAPVSPKIASPAGTRIESTAVH